MPSVIAMSRTGRAAAGVALIGAAVAVGLGWWWPSTADADDVVRERISAVELDTDSGNVTIRTGDVDTTRVQQRFDYTWGEPDAAFSVEDGRLRLADCGWTCSVDYDVVVPRGTSVSGKVDSGNIELEGVTGADVETDSGNIELRDVDGDVKADADSGDIDGIQLSGNVEAEADSGNITLSLAKPGNVTADVDSGNIDLIVPDATYRVSGKTDSGQRDVAVATDPDAGHELELESDSGNVTVARS